MLLMEAGMLLIGGEMLLKGRGTMLIVKTFGILRRGALLIGETLEYS
jgi:hypothetical protein